MARKISTTTPKKAVHKEIKSKTVIKAKETGVKALHFDMTGSKKTSVTLPKEIFADKIAAGLISQTVRVYKMALRQGTQSTKTRGEVAGSTRKLFRQKGTGRARHGSSKAHIFVGGGIAFGPKPRSFNLKLPKKMRQKALRGILTDKAESQSISVVSGLIGAKGKTRETAQLFKEMGLTGKRLLLVIEKDMTNVARGARNIEDITIRRPEGMSFLDVLESEHIIFSEEALKKIKNKEH